MFGKTSFLRYLPSMNHILDGKKIAEQEKQSLKELIAQLKDITPRLDAILIGNNPASKIYVSMKKKACESIGMKSEIHELPEDTNEAALLKLIQELNNKEDVHGILLQLPLPAHLNKENFLNSISPLKDVDCFHPINMGLLLEGKSFFKPCTPLGIIKLLESTGENLEGKHAVIIGRSMLVGKPISLLLLEKNCTVTICHSKTKDISSVTKNADILVVAIGKPHFLNGDAIKEGAIVIDVGINRTADKKIVGDVDFKSAKEKASWITPVPGGVGPMTIAMLLHNTVRAAHLQQEKK
jgi:methylenetetrahydrofolate dehydrogenase (NADP+) / methenyltetrahydrofolate cyclohydrolase